LRANPQRRLPAPPRAWPAAPRPVPLASSKPGSGGRIPAPCLILVTDPSPPLVTAPDSGPARYGESHLAQIVDAAIEGGVDLVQLRVRDERCGPGEILAMAHELKRVTGNRALLFINGHPDIAVASGADGVHLPEALDTVTRADLPQGLLIGRSVHSPAAAERAARAGSDVLVAGAMFATRSHPGLAPNGAKLIGAIRGAIGPYATVPVIGIGGIDPSNAHTVMNAGADGIAVIGAIWGSADAQVATRALRESIDKRLEAS